MKSIASILVAGCLAAGTFGAFAADDMTKKPDSMKKDSPTLQDCKEHMAAAQGTKKSDAYMKMDAACSDMMKKGDAASSPMKK